MGSKINADRGYLEEKRSRVETELASRKAAAAELQDKVNGLYPGLESAARQLKAKLDILVRDEQERHLQEAKKDLLKDALTLMAYESKFEHLPKGLWVGIATVAFATHWLFALVAYGALAYWGREVAAKKLSAPAREALEKILAFDLRYHRFSERESGDHTFPYLCAQAPWPGREQLINSFRINNKDFGPQFGKSFVGLYDPNAREAHFLIRVPSTETSLQVISLSNGFDDKAWPAILELFNRFGHMLDGEEATIRPFSEMVFEIDQNSHGIASLERHLNTLLNIETDWADVAVNSKTLDAILKRVDLFAAGDSAAPKGILLYGPPGTGKTLIAKNIAKTSGCGFVAVGMADLKGQYIGQTAPRVKEAWSKARASAPCILFLDECEGVFAKRGGLESDKFNDEIVQTFLSEWDGINASAGKVFVIGATNQRDNIDEAILSRFTSVIEIGLPDADARRRILALEFKRGGLNFDVSESLVKETAGMSGRDLHQLVTSVRADLLMSEINDESLLKAVRALRGKNSASVAELTWDDIILDVKLKDELKMLGKTIKNAEALGERGLSVPRSMLLYGPPGTGKTQIARVLASEAGLAFMAASTADVKGAWLGHSGKNAKDLFSRARSQSPCILFVDEIDILASARGAGSDKATQEIVGQFLQEMDGVTNKSGQVFVMGATNCPEDIDAAVLSRFETKIEISLPDHAARQAIVALMLGKKPVNFDIAEAASSIASATQGKSGRDLQALVGQMEKRAIHRALAGDDDVSHAVITLEDVEEAVSAANPVQA